jgi:hypothetical protein
VLFASTIAKTPDARKRNGRLPSALAWEITRAIVFLFIPFAYQDRGNHPVAGAKILKAITEQLSQERVQLEGVSR